MASGGRQARVSFTPPDESPDYFKDAFKDLGLQEWVYVGGEKRSNPVVERFIEKVEGKKRNAINTPWCAYWIGAKLEYHDWTSTKSGMARSYLRWGVKVEDGDWQVGDLVIFWRGRNDDGVTGHIGFICSFDDDSVLVLGGNQGDKVSLQYFPISKVLGVRRPRPLTQSRTVKLAVGEGANQATQAVIQAAVEDPKPTTQVLEQAQQSIDQASQAATMLSSWKPEILLVLKCLSILLICGVIYVRIQDAREKGRV